MKKLIYLLSITLLAGLPLFAQEEEQKPAAEEPKTEISIDKETNKSEEIVTIEKEISNEVTLNDGDEKETKEKEELIG